MILNTKGINISSILGTMGIELMDLFGEPVTYVCPGN